MAVKTALDTAVPRDCVVLQVFYMIKIDDKRSVRKKIEFDTGRSPVEYGKMDIGGNHASHAAPLTEMLDLSLGKAGRLRLRNQNQAQQPQE